MLELLYDLLATQSVLNYNASFGLVQWFSIPGTTDRYIPKLILDSNFGLTTLVLTRNNFYWVRPVLDTKIGPVELILVAKTGQSELIFLLQATSSARNTYYVNPVKKAADHCQWMVSWLISY